MRRSSEEYAGQAKVLSPDEQAVALRELREEVSAMAYLADLVKKGEPLDLELAYNILSLKESRLSQLAKLLGIELDSAAARDARYADIRAANLKVRELEKLLGQGASAAQTQAHLSVLGDKLNYWWDVHGFGHVSKMNFTRYGALELELSCMLFGTRVLTHSTAPVTEKQTYEQWVQSLTERGFELATVEGERDPSVIDCDSNRALLRALVAEHLPSAQVVSTSNHYDRSGVCTLRDLHVYVHKLSDVDALPMPPNREA